MKARALLAACILALALPAGACAQRSHGRHGHGAGVRSALIGVARSAAAPPAPAITATTYYVSPQGSDRASGRSPAHAWRTIARVSAATLHPGDGVLFQGGEHFGDAQLMPLTSGSAGRPIVFGSYGNGQAILDQGVWFAQSNLAFENVAFTSTFHGGSPVKGRSAGIYLDRVTITLPTGNGDLGLYSWGDHWVIANSRISNTGLSGMLLNGDDYLISGNTITGTGLDHSNGYNNHGIYVDASDATIRGNVVSGNAESGISVRYRNSTIENNRITGGVEGIDFFETDTQAGRSRWSGNTISGTTGADIFIADSGSGGPTRERFDVTGNDLSKISGRFIDAKGVIGQVLDHANLLRQAAS